MTYPLAARRLVIHQRLDNPALQIAHMETIAVSGQIDAQVRGEIQAVKETVEKNQGVVSPAIEEWKRMKTLGVGISGIIELAGLTIGGIVAYMSETASQGLGTGGKFHIKKKDSLTAGRLFIAAFEVRRRE